jgi:hypothetical protein
MRLALNSSFQTSAHDLVQDSGPAPFNQMTSNPSWSKNPYAARRPYATFDDANRMIRKGRK